METEVGVLGGDVLCAPTNGLREYIETLVPAFRRQILRELDSHAANATAHIQDLLIGSEHPKLDKVAKKLLAALLEVSAADIDHSLRIAPR